MAREVANQLEMFQYNPEIKNLGLTRFSLKGATLTGEFEAVTEAPDLAHLTPERWAQAAAGWLVRLTQGNWQMARDFLEMGHRDFMAALAERGIGEPEELESADYKNEPLDSDEHAQEGASEPAGDAQTENPGEGSVQDDEAANVAPIRRFPRGAK